MSVHFQANNGFLMNSAGFFSFTDHIVLRLRLNVLYTVFKNTLAFLTKYLDELDIIMHSEFDAWTVLCVGSGLLIFE